jgi:indole-3-glycerol phosphate synthase
VPGDPSFLARMARSSADRVRRARALEGEAALARRAAERPAAPPLKLGDFDLIAELKRRSPALGPLESAGFSFAGQLRSYAAAGAAAISVLTEPEAFAGSLDDLETAAAELAASGIPVMRKDFLVDPYQVLEARAAGAGGVLVIMAMLTDAQAGDLLSCAAEQGLFVLLEAFDERDLERICALPRPAADAPWLAGVNCRDLKTLEVVFDRFAVLAPRLPADLPAVAESGMSGRADITRVAELGYRLALVGGALMQAAQPEQAAQDWLRHGREAARARRACS